MMILTKRKNTWSFTIELSRDPITNKRIRFTRGGFKTKKDAMMACVEEEMKKNEK